MSSWGGPGRGGGAIPKDPAAALNKALDTLARRLAVCRKLNTMPYAEREAVFRRIDELQAAAEAFVCAAPDYPNEG